MKKILNYSLKKVIIILLIIYSLFFIIGGIMAPVLAHFKFFYQADTVYELFRRSCHQDAIRCFWIFGYQMAICARCLGAYIGTSSMLYAYLNKHKINKVAYFSLGIIAFGEILLEIFKVTSANNYIRLSAGICLGVFIAMSLIKLIDWLEGKKSW